MIASTQITKTEIFAFIVVLVLKLLSRYYILYLLYKLSHLVEWCFLLSLSRASDRQTTRPSSTSLEWTKRKIIEINQSVFCLWCNIPLNDFI